MTAFILYYKKALQKNVDNKEITNTNDHENIKPAVLKRPY